MKYRYVVEDEVLEVFIRPNTKKRERLLAVLQSIADQAPVGGEFDHRDSVDRPILRQSFNQWTVWFWFDSPVHEVRIVDVEEHPKP